MPTFTEKHAEWTAAIRGDALRPRNAIQWQVVELVHSAAWYRVVLRARQLADAGEGISPKLNPNFHNWIDECFTDSFFVRVRRLAGGDSDVLSGPMSCHSLSALLRDLKSNQSLLTRENLLSLDDLPFDIVETEQKLNKYLRDNKQTGEWLAIPSELDTRRSRQRNAEIDKLCGVSEATRSRTDTVHTAVFDSVRDRLLTLSDMTLITNKLIAHASTLQSRQTDKRGNIEKVQIAIRDLWGALEQLCRSVAAIDGWLINRSSHAFLPEMRKHEWRGIDCPLIETNDIQQLQDYWKELEKEASNWGDPSAAF